MRPRWVIIGLVASLALNLFLIGAGAGVIALGARMAKQGVRPGALFMATAGLPQPERRNMRIMLRQARDAVLSDADRSLTLRTDAWTGLAATKPDVAAIKDKLAQSRQIDIGVRAQVEERIVDYAAQMNPGDRAIFSAGMRRALHPAGAQPAPAPTPPPAPPKS